MTLADQILRGNPRSIARLISMVEDEDPRAYPELQIIYPRSGSARVIGITGPAGAGKSSLISILTGELHRRGDPIGILAVDPSSPFSGGALLGDRIRMREHLGNPHIFIRSLAARGGVGAIAGVLPQAIRILEAAGFTTILVETAGAGQDEVGILDLAGVVLVVLAPGAGDEIQALKAGLLEIGDLFVLNKSDRPDYQLLEEQFLQSGFEPALLERISVQKKEGIARLARRINSLFASKDKKEIRRRFCRWELLHHFERSLVKTGLASITPDLLDRLVRKIALHQSDPYVLCEQMIQRLFPRSGGRDSAESRERRARQT